PRHTRSTCAGLAAARRGASGRRGSDNRIRTRARSSGSRGQDRSVALPRAPAPAAPSPTAPWLPSHRRSPSRPRWRPIAPAWSLRRVSYRCGALEPSGEEVGAQFLLDADLRSVEAVQREILEVSPEAVGTIDRSLICRALNLGGSSPAAHRRVARTVSGTLPRSAGRA